MPFEIVPPGTHIDFIGKRRICALASMGLLLASLAAIPIRGIQWGIDFAGGTEIQVKFAEADVGEAPIRRVMSELPGVQDATVVRFGEPEDREFLIRYLGGLDAEIAVDDAEAAGAAPDAGRESVELRDDRVSRIQELLREAVGPVTVQRVEFVGPRVGAELRNDGMFALFWASVAILVYISIRFSSRFAPGAVAAVIHDLLITAGIFVMLGLDFDLRILAAMLAIMGYSLNDTIIIYDRVRENMARRTTYDLPEVLNQSVNQTLSRTVLTSGTTFVALLSLFFLGGEMIRPFAFAMIIGVGVGTYSSIYVAAPLLLLLERRFGATPAKPARA